jgi:hypothetical protein
LRRPGGRRGPGVSAPRAMQRARRRRGRRGGRRLHRGRCMHQRGRRVCGLRKLRLPAGRQRRLLRRGRPVTDAGRPVRTELRGRRRQRLRRLHGRRRCGLQRGVDAGDAPCRSSVEARRIVVAPIASSSRASMPRAPSPASCSSSIR